MLIDNSDFFTWPTSFSCSLVAEKLILPVQYNLTVSMIPESGQSVSGVGLTKIKKFINTFVQNSVLIHEKNPAIKIISSFESTAIHLPHEPSDFFFSNVLFYKLSSIAKDYFTVCQITIDSSIGDRVKYQINESSIAYKQILNNNSWWSRDDVSTNNIQYFPSWEDLDIVPSTKFSPKIVKGGKHEAQQI